MIVDRVDGARDVSPSFVGSAMIRVDALLVAAVEENIRAFLAIDESILILFVKNTRGLLYQYSYKNVMELLDFNSLTS